ncbi:mucin-2-like [Topomyia yanbarensis]|uniref:mucin-2-like n=1 Tax=Topomyia yanbarensis TaxID=2498891 RepID=UPI00273C5BE8|nr:mucin-2-like [Topomyia yanbarensis]
MKQLITGQKVEVIPDPHLNKVQGIIYDLHTKNIDTTIILETTQEQGVTEIRRITKSNIATNLVGTTQENNTNSNTAETLESNQRPSSPLPVSSWQTNVTRPRRTPGRNRRQEFIYPLPTPRRKNTKNESRPPTKKAFSPAPAPSADVPDRVDEPSAASDAGGPASSREPRNAKTKTTIHTSVVTGSQYASPPDYNNHPNETSNPNPLLISPSEPRNCGPNKKTNTRTQPTSGTTTAAGTNIESRDTFQRLSGSPRYTSTPTTEINRDQNHSEEQTGCSWHPITFHWNTATNTEPTCSMSNSDKPIIVRDVREKAFSSAPAPPADVPAPTDEPSTAAGLHSTTGPQIINIHSPGDPRPDSPSESDSDTLNSGNRSSLALQWNANGLRQNLGALQVIIARHNFIVLAI